MSLNLGLDSSLDSMYVDVYRSVSTDHWARRSLTGVIPYALMHRVCNSMYFGNAGDDSMYSHARSMCFYALRLTVIQWEYTEKLACDAWAFGVSTYLDAYGEWLNIFPADGATSRVFPGSFKNRGPFVHIKGFSELETGACIVPSCVMKCEIFTCALLIPSPSCLQTGPNVAITSSIRLRGGAGQFQFYCSIRSTTDPIVLCFCIYQGSAEFIPCDWEAKLPQTVQQLLDKQLPVYPDEKLGDINDWFSVKEPIDYEVTLELFWEIPGEGILSALASSVGPRSKDGFKSVLWKQYEWIRFPLWAVKYWTTLLSAKKAHESWLESVCWLEKHEKDPSEVCGSFVTLISFQLGLDKVLIFVTMEKDTSISP